MANPLLAPSPLRDVINPQFYQNNFPAEVYIKTELGIKLDKGLFYSLTVNLNAYVCPFVQMIRFVAYLLLQLGVLLALFIALCVILHHLPKTSNPQSNCQRILVNENVYRRSASIGCGACVKREMLVNFFTSIT